MNEFQQMAYLEKEAQRAVAQHELERERRESLFLSILLIIFALFGAN